MRDDNGALIPEVIVHPPNPAMLVKLLAKLAPEVYGERSTVEHVHSGFVWIEGSSPPAALPVPFHGDFNQDFGLATPREGCGVRPTPWRCRDRAPTRRNSTSASARSCCAS